MRELLRASMLLASVVGAGAAMVLAALGQLLGLLGQDAAVAALAQPIMLTLAPGLLPMLWLNVLRQFAVGMRRAGPLLAVSVALIAINALLNAVFVCGWLGMPRLGLAGIGLATTVVQVWSFGVYLRTLRRDERLKGLLALDGWRARGASVGQIARMGAPIALTYGSEAALACVASLLIGAFGPLALAASNIVNQLTAIVYQLSIGLSHGASILVSRAAGRGQGQEIGAIALCALAIGAALMGVAALVYVLLPGVVLRPFLGARADPALFAAASGLLWFAIALQFVKAWQNICIGLLRGLGNTMAGLTATLIGYWLVGIPAMAACGHWAGWESQGVWFGLCLGFAVAALLLWRRFHPELRGARAAQAQGRG